MTDRVLTPLRVSHVENPWYNHVVLMDDVGMEVVPTLQMVVASHERLRAERDLLRAALEKIAERGCMRVEGNYSENDLVWNAHEANVNEAAAAIAAVDAFDKEG